MTRTKVRYSIAQQQLRNQRSRTKELTLEQQKALGDFALICGPAFIIGFWGVTAFTSGMVQALGTVF